MTRKFENGESRGGGFRSFQEIMETRKKVPAGRSKVASNQLPGYPEVLKPPQADRIPVQATSPHKNAPQSLTELSELEYAVMNISRDIGDYKHVLENTRQAKNIFSLLKSRGVTEYQFIGTLHDVKGLTVEIINFLERPGAYFFRVLRDKWEISVKSQTKTLYATT